MGIGIHVHAPTGDSYTVEVLEGDSMSELHSKVAAAVGAADTTFELCYEGKALRRRTAETVKSMELCEGSELRLFVRKDPMCVHVSDLGDEEALKKIRATLATYPEGILSVDVSGVRGELSLRSIPNGVRRLAVVCCSPDETHITKIGDGFLEQPAGEALFELTTIDLRGLSGVTEVGDGFMLGHRLPNSVDLTPLSSVTTIKGSLLAHCELPSVDLGPLHNVTSIGASFLSDTVLPTVDLTPLSKLAIIGDSFLACSRVKTITWAVPSEITNVPNWCFRGCDNLESVDLRGLANVTSIGAGFLSWSSLREVDLSPLGNVTALRFNFLFRTPLECVDLTPLTKVVEVSTSGDCLNACKEVRVAEGSLLEKELKGVGGLPLVVMPKKGEQHRSARCQPS